MEEIVKQYLECISRSRKAQRLLQQDLDEIGLSLKGDILKPYRELMEIEVEHIERVRKALNDTADLNR
jgi:hypothetical protein